RECGTRFGTTPCPSARNWSFTRVYSRQREARESRDCLRGEDLRLDEAHRGRRALGKPAVARRAEEPEIGAPHGERIGLVPRRRGGRGLRGERDDQVELLFQVGSDVLEELERKTGREIRDQAQRARSSGSVVRHREESAGVGGVVDKIVLSGPLA